MYDELAATFKKEHEEVNDDMKKRVLAMEEQIGSIVRAPSAPWILPLHADPAMPLMHFSLSLFLSRSRSLSLSLSILCLFILTANLLGVKVACV
jgi:hypothetical protein